MKLPSSALPLSATLLAACGAQSMTPQAADDLKCTVIETTVTDNHNGTYTARGCGREVQYRCDSGAKGDLKAKCKKM